MLNRINRLNEMTVLFASYILVIMTDLQPDIELRNQIGWFFIYSILIVVIINFALISFKILKLPCIKLNNRINLKFQ